MKDLRASEILHKYCRTKARKDIHIMMTIRSSVWSTITRLTTINHSCDL